MQQLVHYQFYPIEHPRVLDEVVKGWGCVAGAPGSNPGRGLFWGENKERKEKKDKRRKGTTPS